MPKVLAQAGFSLADVYDVQGSIAGVDQLVTEEVHLVHEMGGTIFSERLGGAIIRATTGALNQSTTWDVITTGLPAGIWRVEGVYVQSDTAGRSDRAQVSLRDINAGREFPLFVWDATNDFQSDIRIIENGAAVGNDAALIQTSPVPNLPSLGIASGQRTQRVGEEIAFRGQTTAFGAGTITHTALIYIAFMRLRGVSSIGLPIPGW